MPKIKYQEFKFRPPTVGADRNRKHDHCRIPASRIDLTLRQLYYQFVSRDVIPNTQRAYKNLGSIVNDGHPRSFRQPPVRPVQDFMAHLVIWEGLRITASTRITIPPSRFSAGVGRDAGRPPQDSGESSKPHGHAHGAARAVVGGRKMRRAIPGKLPWTKGC